MTLSQAIKAAHKSYTPLSTLIMHLRRCEPNAAELTDFLNMYCEEFWALEWAILRGDEDALTDLVNSPLGEIGSLACALLERLQQQRTKNKTPNNK